jgi:hypothetical protein
MDLQDPAAMTMDRCTNCCCCTDLLQILEEVAPTDHVFLFM